MARARKGQGEAAGSDGSEKDGVSQAEECFSWQRLTWGRLGSVESGQSSGKRYSPSWCAFRARHRDLSRYSLSLFSNLLCFFSFPRS